MVIFQSTQFLEQQKLKNCTMMRFFCLLLTFLRTFLKKLILESAPENLTFLYIVYMKAYVISFILNIICILGTYKKFAFNLIAFNSLIITRFCFTIIISFFGNYNVMKTVLSTSRVTNYSSSSTY